MAGKEKLNHFMFSFFLSFFLSFLLFPPFFLPPFYLFLYSFESLAAGWTALIHWLFLLLLF